MQLSKKQQYVFLIKIWMYLELFLFAKKMEWFIVYPGLSLAILFYARAVIGRTEGA